MARRARTGIFLKTAIHEAATTCTFLPPTPTGKKGEPGPVILKNKEMWLKIMDEVKTMINHDPALHVALAEVFLMTWSTWPRAPQGAQEHED